MIDDIDQLLTMTEASYRALLARSWTLLLERTPPDDAAAITAASDLQRELIQTGAAWLSLCERVRGLAQGSPAPNAADATAQPGPVASGSPATGQPAAEHEVRTIPRRRPQAQRRAARRRRQRLQVPRPLPHRRPTTPAAVSLPVEPPIPAVGMPDEAAQAQTYDTRAAAELPGMAAPARSAAGEDVAVVDVPARAEVEAPEAPAPALAGQEAAPPEPEIAAPLNDLPVVGAPDAGPRIFPLLAGALPPRAQPAAFAFNGTNWLPVAAWRRVFQHVLQTLQGSDPARFTQMAADLTLHNGRLLFNRERERNLGPIDAGGGWYTTGQMPTDLILQRLRKVLEWWGLPLTGLEVELAPRTQMGGTRVGPAGAAAEPDVAPTPEASDEAIAAPVDDGVALQPAAAPADAGATVEAPGEMAAESPRAPEAAEADVEQDSSTAAQALNAPLPDPRTLSAGPDEATVERISVTPAAPASDIVRDIPAASAGHTPARRSRTYAAATAPPVDAASGTTGEPPPDTEAPETATVESQAGASAPEVVPAPAADMAQPAVAPAAASPAPPAPDEVPARRRVFTSGQAADAPERSSRPVRWVKTASGTPLPMRPASSDD